LKESIPTKFAVFSLQEEGDREWLRKKYFFILIFLHIANTESAMVSQTDF
jgi:hypothetical protein